MLELNKIYCGDCLEIMSLVDDKSIDMILCDLPYGITACKWDKVISLDKLWEQYKRIIKDNGAIVLTASQPFTTDLINSNRKWFKYEWIWNKIIGKNFLLANKMPLKAHENILIFYNSLPTYNPQKIILRSIEGAKRLKRNAWGYRHSNHYGKLIPSKVSGDYKFPISVIEIMVQNSSNQFTNKYTYHDTQKPVALFKYLIKTYTNEGDLVLDNCIGSGTTAVACKLLGRNFIGIEINPDYVEIANRRLANTYRQMELIK